MQLGMARLGRQGLRNGFADLDLVAASIGANPNRLAAAIEADIARRTAGPGSAP
jgi:hypothetical protein